MDFTPSANAMMRRKKRLEQEAAGQRYGASDFLAADPNMPGASMEMDAMEAELEGGRGPEGALPPTPAPSASEDDVFAQYLSSQEDMDRMKAITSAGAGQGGVSGAIAPLTTAMTTSGNPYAMAGGIAVQGAAGLFDAYGSAKEKEAAEARAAAERKRMEAERRAMKNRQQASDVRGGMADLRAGRENYLDRSRAMGRGFAGGYADYLNRRMS